MTLDEFLVELSDVLQTDEKLTCDTVLADLPEWDSLAIMSIMAFLEYNFGVKTSMVDYAIMKTVNDIIVKAGIQNDFI